MPSRITNYLASSFDAFSYLLTREKHLYCNKTSQMKTKVFLREAIISGTIFATAMAVFSLIQGEAFSILSYLFHFVGFGVFMGIFRYRRVTSVLGFLSDEAFAGYTTSRKQSLTIQSKHSISEIVKTLKKTTLLKM